MAWLKFPALIKHIPDYGCRSGLKLMQITCINVAVLTQALVEFWRSGWKTTVADSSRNQCGRSYV